VEVIPIYLQGTAVCLRMAGHGHTGVAEFSGLVSSLKEANGGDSFSQVRYGLCLQRALGVGRHLTEAARYLSLSAEQHNSRTRYEYYMCLSQGTGLQQDADEAVRLFKNMARAPTTRSGWLASTACCGWAAASIGT
jgi:TPR repeat protein